MWTKELNGKEFDSYEDLKAFLDKKMKDTNEQPNPEIDGLSPNQMHKILYETFEPDSPVGFKADAKEELLKQSPFLSLVIRFLEIVKTAGELKLTTKGNLPVKICKELYDLGLIKEPMIEAGISKMYKEEDSVALQNTKIMCTLSGIVKKRNNKLSLTAKGKRLLQHSSRFPLFKEIFPIQVSKFNWGYHDGYGEHTNIQFTFGYTLYLLLKYGKEERNIDFYVDKTLMAFPDLSSRFGSSQFRSKKERYKSCYTIRVFTRFLDHYGLVDLKHEKKLRESDKVELKTTALFYTVFERR